MSVFKRTKLNSGPRNNNSKLENPKDTLFCKYELGMGAPSSAFKKGAYVAPDSPLTNFKSPLLLLGGHLPTVQESVVMPALHFDYRPRVSLPAATRRCGCTGSPAAFRIACAMTPLHPDPFARRGPPSTWVASVCSRTGCSKRVYEKCQIA